LSWLQKLGYALNAIAPAMVKLGTNGTLAQLYARLTSGPESDGWPKFLSAAKALSQITNDDPFGTWSSAGRQLKAVAKPRARRKALPSRKR
jgi:hypothetical protein